MTKKYELNQEALTLADISRELSDLFYDIKNKQLLNLFENINGGSEFKKEIAKLQKNFYLAAEKHFRTSLGKVKLQIDKNIKDIRKILTKDELSAKMMKNLDNSSDNIDMLQELKNRFLEIADIKIANIKLSDEIGKYLKYLGSRILKFTARERKIFDENIAKIKKNYQNNVDQLYETMNKDNLLKYVFGIN